MSKRKKTEKKEEISVPTYYATLSKEQYDVIHDVVNWDNPLSNLESIKNNGDSSMLELGFSIGEVYKEFQAMFEKLENVMNEIEPENQEEDNDWNYDTSDETDEENN